MVEVNLFIHRLVLAAFVCSLAALGSPAVAYVEARQGVLVGSHSQLAREMADRFWRLWGQGEDRSRFMISPRETRGQPRDGWLTMAYEVSHPDDELEATLFISEKFGSERPIFAGGFWRDYFKRNYRAQPLPNAPTPEQIAAHERHAKVFGRALIGEQWNIRALHAFIAPDRWSPPGLNVFIGATPWAPFAIAGFMNLEIAPGNPFAGTEAGFLEFMLRTPIVALPAWGATPKASQKPGDRLVCLGAVGSQAVAR